MLDLAMTKHDVHEFTEALHTGDAELDDDHRKFFALAQALDTASRKGSLVRDVGRALAALGDYAARHFAREEAHMKALGFPYAETHKAAHRSFSNHLDELRRELDRSSDPQHVARRVADFALDWLTRHIKLVDSLLVDAAKRQRSTREP